MPEVSFVILTFNHLDLTQRLVESIQDRAGPTSYELIFVDSGSTDGSLAYFSALENAHTIVTAGEPFVFNRNMNRGISAASGEVVICANNDVEVLSNDFLTPIVRTLRDNPAVGVLAIELSDPANAPIKLNLVKGYTQGCFFAVRKELWQLIGGFTELYTGYGCEEADVSLRMLRYGYYTGFLQGVHCRHVGGATFQEGKAPYEACLKNAKVFEQLHGYHLNFQEGCDFWANLNSYLGCVFAYEWNKRTTRVDLGWHGKKPHGYTRIDLSPAPQVDLVWDLTDGLPYPDSTVDEVRADNILEHLPDPVRSMNEIYRVLKPGGVLNAVVPSTDGRAAWEDPSHRSFWNDSSWKYYCENGDTDPEHQRRLGVRCRFRSESVETKNIDSSPYTCAQLRAIK